MFDFCGRPEDYEEKLYRSMRQIPHDAVLIHLGDICIGDDERVHEEFIKTLDCKKWLVRGNHDSKSDTWYLNHGWDAVVSAMIMKIAGLEVVLSHKPQSDLGYRINIHGHYHNSDHRSTEPELQEIYTSQHKLLAVEYTNYKAVLADKWLRSQLSPDHFFGNKHKKKKWMRNKK